MKKLKIIILCAMISFISYNLSPNTIICKDIPQQKVQTKVLAYNVGLRKANGRFRKFTTPEAGYNALVNDIEIKQSGRSHVMDSTVTLEEFIQLYVPSFENNTSKYINILRDSLQVPKHTPLTMIDKFSLAKYILMMENKKIFDLLFGEVKSQEEL